MPPLQPIFDRACRRRFPPKPPTGGGSESQAHLRPGNTRPPKKGRIQPEALNDIQAQAPPSDLKSTSNQLRYRPDPAHAIAEVGIIVASAAHILDQGHDVG